jgi:hypothetical protein
MSSACTGINDEGFLQIWKTVSKLMEKTILLALKSYGNDNNSCLAYFEQRRAIDGVWKMELKTPSGRAIEADAIDYILWGRMATDILGTLVQLKTGDEVFLLNSDEEVVEAMRKHVEKSAVSLPQTLVTHAAVTRREARSLTEVIRTSRRLTDEEANKFREALPTKIDIAIAQAQRSIDFSGASETSHQDRA